MIKQYKYLYVYLITNHILNKQYIGSRMCYKDKIGDDLYWGSSKYLKKDFEIYGKNNFSKIILQYDYQNVTDLLNGETEYILAYNTLTPNGYNRFLPNSKTGFHMNGVESPMKNKRHKDKSKEKMSNSHKGIKFSDDHKLHLRQSVKYSKDIASDEEKQRRHEYTSGERNGMYGVKRDDHPMYGKHHTMDAIKSIREKNKINFAGDKNPMYGICPEKIICPHCNKLIDKRNFSRWHGNKCKKINK